MKHRISESEWQVLDALWALDGGTTSAVQARLAHTGWSRNTVHTFLTRLETKGFVRDTGGSPKRYEAGVSREECVRAETDSFVSRVFDGSASLLVKTFLQEKELDSAELSELRRLLDDAEKRG